MKWLAEHQLEAKDAVRAAEARWRGLIPADYGEQVHRVGARFAILEAALMLGVVINGWGEQTNLYTSDKLPKRNADFEMYGLLISPKAGLCQIRAVGKNIDTDSYGLALKSRFEDLSSSLSSLYGKAETTDLLLAGSIWKEPQDWMMGLNKKERFLSATWKGTKEMPLKTNIGAISIEARANSSAQGYVYLQYTFTNDDVCQTEIEGAKKNSL